MSRSILFVINGLGTGGSERSLAELLPVLGTAGIAVEVAYLYRRAEGVQREIEARGVPVHSLAKRGLSGRVLQLRRRLREGRFGLLHTVHFEADLAGRLAAAGTGVQVVSSLVNTTYDPVRWADPRVDPRKLRWVRRTDGWTARHLTHRFHAVSQAVKDSAVRALGLNPERVTVVHRGRDPERLGEPGPERRSRVRRALDLAPESEVLIHVGRHEFQKGLPVLLQAAAGWLRGQRGRVLLLAGREGHASPALRRLHRDLGLGDRCRFLGHRSDVPDLLAAADLFVFPSLYEGLPGALLEAMALALPVVASDIPAIREVTGSEAALLVAPGDPAGLRAAVEGLLAQPDRAKNRGEHGRRIFHRRFTLERSASSMLAFYDRLLPDPDVPSEPTPSP